MQKIRNGWSQSKVARPTVGKSGDLVEAEGGSLSNQVLDKKEDSTPVLTSMEPSRVF